MGDNKIRCEVCGKFISEQDFADDKIKVTFIPDTQYTVEKTYYRHRACIKDIVNDVFEQIVSGKNPY